MIMWIKQRLQPSERWRSTRKPFQLLSSCWVSPQGGQTLPNPQHTVLLSLSLCVCLHPPILSSAGPLWSKNRGRDTEKQVWCSTVCIPPVIYSIWENLREAVSAGSQRKRPVTALLPSMMTEQARGKNVWPIDHRGRTKKNENTLITWHSCDKRTLCWKSFT